MLTPPELIGKFYSALDRKDWQAMNDCYDSEIIFSDPAFGLLKGDEARAMWEMLCTGAKDLRVDYSNINAVDEEYYTCDWTARYTFSATGRKVVNVIRAFMRIRGGKIVEHSDAFRLSRWAGQALGWKGKLLGWSGFFQRKLQQRARQRLAAFMERKKA